jgi:hypothetical protein
MAETEVESILREIRERVLSQERAANGATASVATPASDGKAGNGASDSGPQQMASVGHPETIAAENLALINSYLTTTARAWDRLPPVVSNRSGVAARLELWIKRHLKRATRWYSWEQVNFNAAVHHALRDMLPVLAAYERELGKLHAQLDEEAAARQTEMERNQTQRVELNAEIEALRVAMATERQSTGAQRSQFDARIADLTRELRERDERLQGEQRVSFKQLSLESSEAAVLEDRARRKNEALLQELTHRVEDLEKR